MRRILLFILALALAACLHAGLAEADWVALPPGVEWGATQEAVTAVLGAAASFITFEGDATGLNWNGSALGVAVDDAYMFIQGKLVMRLLTFDGKDISAERIAEALGELYGAPEALSQERFRAMFGIVAGEAAIDAAIGTEIFKGIRAYTGPGGCCVAMMSDAANTGVLIADEALILSLRAEAEAKAAAATHEPYDEALAGEVLLALTRVYMDADAQCAYMKDLTFWSYGIQARKGLENLARLRTMSAAEALERIDALLATGDVMPWTGAALDRDACAALLNLCETWAVEYAEYADWIDYVSCHADAAEAYGGTAEYNLTMALEFDANILVTLYELAYKPLLPEADGASGVPAQCLEMLESAAVLKEKSRRQSDEPSSPEVLRYFVEVLKADRQVWLDRAIATGVREDCAAWKAGR